MTHNIQRQHDEYYCNRCGKRWGFDEAEPDCVMTRSKMIRHDYTDFRGNYHDPEYLDQSMMDNAT